MTTAFRPRTLVLFAGDIVFFIFSLWLSLFLRVLALPSREIFLEHLVPFSLLFVAWIVVFFIAGLYESRSIILQQRAVSGALLVAQTLNIVIAALFFFFVPSFGIAPKTLLFIYAAVSFALVLLWRTVLFPRLGLQKQEQALIVGSGIEMKELADALAKARFAPVHVSALIESASTNASSVREAIATYHPRFIIANFNDPKVTAAFPEFYNYPSRGISFVDAMMLYEEVFGRMPLSVIDDAWVARHVSRYSHTLYDSLKRLMDICIALPAAIISLIFYPFIALAVKLQDGGSVLITQERVGEDNEPVQVYKFRTMTKNEVDLAKGMEGNKVTTVGNILRLTRLDELPQLWAIVRGDLSFVGPRPELPSGVQLYEKEIPYYGIRHLIRPGLSGWAQLYHDNHPHHGSDVEATREKLSYDLYYIKHRSLILDATIALKTLKKLLTRSGV